MITNNPTVPDAAATDGVATWHLAGWTDWKHTAARIVFASPENARLAARMCRGDGLATDIAPLSGSGSEPASAESRQESARGTGAWEDEGGALRLRKDP